MYTFYWKTRVFVKFLSGEVVGAIQSYKVRPETRNRESDRLTARSDSSLTFYSTIFILQEEIPHAIQ